MPYKEDYLVVCMDVSPTQLLKIWPSFSSEKDKKPGLDMSISVMGWSIYL